MTLQELIARHGRRANHSVPDWMLGFWKRHSISFANGMTDLHTHVCWVQSRNFTIDLRLPLEQDQVRPKSLDQYSADELLCLANYEGWCADSDWDGHALRWADTDITLQLHNRWPEPAFLRRTGNCMIEHCPSNIYVEDWRLQASDHGPLVGLRLIEEREVDSGKLRHQGGGLIVCGDYAALTLGRSMPMPTGTQFKALVSAAAAAQDAEHLQQLFNFETSVATSVSAGDYRVMLSTSPQRLGTALFSPDGFDYLADSGQVRHVFTVDGIACERLFEIDTLEAEIHYRQDTPAPASSNTWFEQETPTLGRYLEVLD
ncbi:MAG TPA: hypothetical protein VL550_09560 [Rhodocyclaceae bacterium]|nr:hypothetical protein [Rhodocyclaceae bacterium]